MWASRVFRRSAVRLPSLSPAANLKICAVASSVGGSKGYQAQYQRSIESTGPFWRDEGLKRLFWREEFYKTRQEDLFSGNISWYLGGKLNAAENCVDRHLNTRRDQAALIWEKDEPGQHEEITYGMLNEEVNRFANALKARGVRKVGIAPSPLPPPDSSYPCVIHVIALFLHIPRVIEYVCTCP